MDGSGALVIGAIVRAYLTFNGAFVGQATTDANGTFVIASPVYWSITFFGWILFRFSRYIWNDFRYSRT